MTQRVDELYYGFGNAIHREEQGKLRVTVG